MNGAESKEINSFFFFVFPSCQAHIRFSFSGVFDLVKKFKDIDYALKKVLLYTFILYLLWSLMEIC